MKVACHAGQLLQPVPGGIGRYVRELLERLSNAGAEPIAFAAGARPRNAPPGVPWIDLGFPHGSARYELWNRARLPAVRIDADVVHAPSLAVPPTRGTPLAVTVHDIAFLRVPENTTRRGASFHRRGLEIARNDAALVLAPSAFTRVELIREGFEPEGVVVAPLGVNPPVARDDDEIDATVAYLGVRHPFLLTVGTVEPRKDLPTIVAALQRLRGDATGSRAARRRTAGVGRGLRLGSTGRARARPAPLARRRRLVPARCRLRHRVALRRLRAPRAGSARGRAPVVAADDSALAEVVGDAGLLFPPGDIAALTSAIETILDDDVLRSQLRERGPRRAATLTWEASARAHVDAFRLAAARQLQQR